MGCKELIVKSYITREGEEILFNELPKVEKARLATAWTDIFMRTLGYTPSKKTKEDNK